MDGLAELQSPVILLDRPLNGLPARPMALMGFLVSAVPAPIYRRASPLL